MFVKSFLIKFVMIFATVFIVLGWYYNVGLVDVLITTIALLVLGYIGDIFLLPRIGNSLATLGDLILDILVIYGIGTILYNEIPLLNAALATSLILILGELFLHPYIEKKISDKHATDPKDKKGYYERVSLYKEYAEYQRKK